MRKILFKTLRTFFFGLYQINFCINFFLYFAAGVQFRRHLSFKLGKLHLWLKRIFWKSNRKCPSQVLNIPNPAAATAATLDDPTLVPTEQGTDGIYRARSFSQSDPCIMIIMSHLNNASRQNSGTSSSDPSSNATIESNVSSLKSNHKIITASSPGENNIISSCSFP